MANVPDFDFNLVRVFNALMRHGGVSAAARALDLSQPGVSHALKRLREATGDDLFVQTRRGMQPTAHALGIADGLRDGMELIQSGLRSSAAFDPATDRRRFRLLMTDAGEVVLLPGLIRALRSEAPGVDVEVRQLAVDRYREALEMGEADLAIGNVRAISDALYHTSLFEERHVLICRAGHPLAARKPTLADFINAEHVSVLPPNSPGAIESFLAERGIVRRAVVQIPHYMVLVAMIRDTDLVSAVPSRIARALCGSGDLVTLPLPFEPPVFSVGIGWHRRQHLDAANRWMRNLLTLVIRAQDRAAPSYSPGE